MKNKIKTITVDTGKFMNTLNYINVMNMYHEYRDDEVKMLRAKVIYMEEIVKGDLHAETDFQEWLELTFTKQGKVRKKYRKHKLFHRNGDKEIFFLKEGILDDGILDERYLPKDNTVKKFKASEYLSKKIKK